MGDIRWWGNTLFVNVLTEALRVNKNLSFDPTDPVRPRQNSRPQIQCDRPRRWSAPHRYLHNRPDIRRVIRQQAPGSRAHPQLPRKWDGANLSSFASQQKGTLAWVGSAVWIRCTVLPAGMFNLSIPHMVAEAPGSTGKSDLSVWEFKGLQRNFVFCRTCCDNLELLSPRIVNLYRIP